MASNCDHRHQAPQQGETERTPLDRQPASDRGSIQENLGELVKTGESKHGGFLLVTLQTILQRVASKRRIHLGVCRRYLFGVDFKRWKKTKGHRNP